MIGSNKNEYIYDYNFVTYAYFFQTRRFSLTLDTIDILRLVYLNFYRNKKTITISIN